MSPSNGDLVKRSHGLANVGSSMYEYVRVSMYDYVCIGDKTRSPQAVDRINPDTADTKLFHEDAADALG